ncbi:MAG: Peptidyl-dipeptidase dcp, partial [Planctomycetota bacterium]
MSMYLPNWTSSGVMGSLGFWLVCLLAVGNGVVMKAENPFLVKSALPLEAPPFDSIKIEDYMPAFEAGMKQQMEEIREIAENSEAPTFENTLVRLEKSGAILKRVSAVFFNLTNSNTTPELQALEEQIAPRLASHMDNIMLDRKLFERVEQLWNSRNILKLSEEQMRLLEELHQGFIRAGAKLDDKSQARVRTINEELSKATTQFQNNLLAITKERAVVVDRASELEGMSAADIQAAAEAAKQKGLEGKYLLSITNTTRQPVLVSLKNRALRQRVWEASANRGIGENGGLDNRPLVIQLAKLRAEKANLLGFANHAEYTLQNQMAKKPEAAMKMLSDLVPQVVAKVRAESQEIAKFMKQDGIEGEV